jgi:hypothetical protein
MSPKARPLPSQAAKPGRLARAVIAVAAIPAEAHAWVYRRKSCAPGERN